MIKITNQVRIDESELAFSFIRASGPGGQNINKVATAVQLRFNVPHSASLAEDVKTRLIRLAGRRMTIDGDLLIEAKRHRTQEQNKEDAVERLTKLVQRALLKPKKRFRTQPSRSAREKRLKEKKIKGAIKKNRQKSAFE